MEGGKMNELAAIASLREFNKWRRGEDWNQQMPCPKQTSEVIDAVCDGCEALIRERDEARELARNLYSAGHELRRFAEAYAEDYDEVDGKPGALEAISDFYAAIKDIAKILGEEAAK
jgi:hypothetical protein